MSIQYKIDPLAALKSAVYTTYKLRQERMIGEAMMQKMREGKPVSWATLDTLCRLLNCQPGDLMEYVPEKAE